MKGYERNKVPWCFVLRNTGGILEKNAVSLVVVV